MIVKTFPVGAFQCNCTLIADETTGEAIVVDPGDEAPKILALVEKMGMKVKYLLHTHAHLDHIGATKKVSEATSAKICLHKDDLFLYENIAMQGEFLGLRLDPVVAPVTNYLEHKDVLEWGSQKRVTTIHSPGHTPGSLTFHLENAIDGKDLVLAGDTLFQRSIGRTDLWGGDYDLILDSIKTRLLTLPENAIVICGHGPNTSIGQEKKHNPFINA